jgi:16S rRNA (guanine527-N7)-methyltransferase
MIVQTFIEENKATLDRLTAFMLAYNEHTNLTRIVEPSEIVEKHYIDSLLPLTLYNVPRGTSLLDVGSGAGFPGIPMKLARPDLSVTLLDSARKRTDYLSAVLREIGVDCTVLNGRSEVFSHDSAFREKYGVVTARAVANLAALCEYCLAFVEVGGVFLALKGEDDEVGSAGRAIALLGGEVEKVHGYFLDGGDKRNLVVIRKVRQTPAEYPRKRVNITKNPISQNRRMSPKSTEVCTILENITKNPML